MDDVLSTGYLADAEAACRMGADRRLLPVPELASDARVLDKLSGHLDGATRERVYREKENQKVRPARACGTSCGRPERTETLAA